MIKLTVSTFLFFRKIVFWINVFLLLSNAKLNFCNIILCLYMLQLCKLILIKCFSNKFSWCFMLFLYVFLPVKFGFTMDTCICRYLCQKKQQFLHVICIRKMNFMQSNLDLPQKTKRFAFLAPCCVFLAMAEIIP